MNDSRAVPGEQPAPSECPSGCEGGWVDGPQMNTLMHPPRPNQMPCADPWHGAAPSPDEDTRREVAELIELLRGGWWDDSECEYVCGLLAAAYLRDSDGR